MHLQTIYRNWIQESSNLPKLIKNQEPHITRKIIDEWFESVVTELMENVFDSEDGNEFEYEMEMTNGIDRCVGVEISRCFLKSVRCINPEIQLSYDNETKEGFAKLKVSENFIENMLELKMF